MRAVGAAWMRRRTTLTQLLSLWFPLEAPACEMPLTGPSRTGCHVDQELNTSLTGQQLLEEVEFLCVTRGVMRFARAVCAQHCHMSIAWPHTTQHLRVNGLPGDIDALAALYVRDLRLVLRCFSSPGMAPCALRDGAKASMDDGLMKWLPEAQASTISGRCRVFCALSFIDSCLSCKFSHLPLSAGRVRAPHSRLETVVALSSATTCRPPFAG